MARNSLECIRQAYKSVMKMLESPNLPEAKRVPGLVWHEAFPDELFLDLYMDHDDHGGAGCYVRCVPQQSHTCMIRYEVLGRPLATVKVSGMLF